jgi:hypothetical protein
MIPVFLSHLQIIWPKSEFKLHSSKWSQTNQLVLNTNKIYIVKFTSSKALTYPLNIIHVFKIHAIAETIKFLDLHWDNHLWWKSHINVLLKKLNCVCFMMRKLPYVLNTDTLRITYFAHFQSLWYKMWYNILGLINNHVQCIFNTKKNNKNQAGTRS